MKSEKDTYNMISLYVESKKMIQRNLSTKQKQTHKHREQTYGYQRGEVQEGTNEELEISRCTLLYVNQTSNKVLLCGARN